MALVDPNNGRVTVIKENKYLCLIIPAKKRYFIIAFLSLWLVGWLFGEVTVSKVLLSGGPEDGAIVFLMAWLLMWTIGGLFAVYILLWNLFGSEYAEFENGILSIEKRMFGIGRSKEYLLSEASNFRYDISGSLNPFMSNRRGLEYWGLGKGDIVFDYGLKTAGFAPDIDEAEANHLIGIINNYFEEYRQ